MRLFQPVLAIVLVVFMMHHVTAQDLDSLTTYKVKTEDGVVHVGTIIKQSEDRLTLLTEKSGEVIIFKKFIVSIQKYEDEKGRKFTDESYNLQSARYFVGSNAYSLRKGEGYYQNSWVLFNQAEVGLTDNLSIGAGTIPLFMFAGSATPLWVTPKISMPLVRDKLNFGVRGLFGGVLGENNSGFGLLSGTITIGSRDTNLSVGAGYAWVGGEWSSGPAFSISGMLRTGPKGYLIMENYFADFGGDMGGIMMFGGRRMINKISLDFGGIIPVAPASKFVLVPWLSVTIPFGKKY